MCHSRPSLDSDTVGERRAHMTVTELVRELESLGVRLWEESGQVRFRAPRGVLTADRKHALRDRKEEVLEHLRLAAETVAVTPEPSRRFEPFPLSDLQSAYLLGRRDTFVWGGVGSHIYAEIAFTDVEPSRLQAAWQTLVRRHDMLRAVADAAGFQQVLPEVPELPIPVDDLRGHSPAVAEDAIAATRSAMDHRTYEPDRWPLFDLRCSQLTDGLRLHLSIDFLIADFSSIQRLLLDLNQLCYEPDNPLPELDLTYRDYLLGMRKLRDSPRYDRDQAYWWSRLDDFPAAPDLPTARLPGTGAAFRRHSLSMTDDEWMQLRVRSAEEGLTLSVAVLAAFAEVVGRWSAQPRFALNLTLFNRQPLHPQADQLVGDFTALSLLAVDTTPASGFADRARRIQARLWEDMDHRTCSGVDVVRELTRRRGPGSGLMPVVFTSTIGLNEVGTGERHRRGQGQFVYGITQTPQVWIDCQVTELNQGLTVNWDVRDGVFPDGLVQDMVAAMEDLLGSLAAGVPAWQAWSPVRPPAYQAERNRMLNQTVAEVPDRLLHEGTLAQALQTPDLAAVITSRRTLSYAELLGRALAVAAELATAGPIVAVVMDKGWEQVVGAYGVLLSGRAYLPIDTHQPPARRMQILADAGARVVLTQSWLAGEDWWPADVRTIVVDKLPRNDIPGQLPARQAGPDDLAYVIYTSGSTGQPKGVMVSHRSAVNTVAEINRRFGVGLRDRVLGLALLGFDLSVYDTFGPMAAGGALVLPDADRRHDPSHWATMIERCGVTLLNSVPAQLHLLHTYLEVSPGVTLPTLRMAFLSGDRIPVALPGRVRARLSRIELVSLGGPTETTIWSICYPIGEVGPDWRSIPYGKPLANHTHHVLDAWLRPCPDWVSGELYGGGLGVAIGYLNDERHTSERFLRHPATGERIYRTGDVGRYLPDGNIEILGRADAEVKVRGHRVALAEVEAALLGHPEVGAACALVDGDAPLEQRLVAFVAGTRRDVSDPAPGPNGHSLRTALAGAAEVAAGQDAQGYGRVAARLETVALRLMLGTLRQRGVFSDPQRPCPVPEILEWAEVADRHVRVIRRWLRALAREGYLVQDPDGYHPSARPAAADLDEIWRELSELKRELPSERALVEYFESAARALPDVISGRADPMQLLYPQGALENAEAVFRDNFASRAANGLLAESLLELAATGGRPGPLRVLEVGAGHWGATGELLSRLDGLDVEYLFTDVSEFFVANARATFGEYDWVGYAVFDLNRDYRSQDLSANSFDVIVCPNVLHYAQHADVAIGRFRELLAPGGWLVFTDTVRDVYYVLASVEFLFRFADGGTDFADVRAGQDQTFLGVRQWVDTLRAAGAEETLVLPGDDHVLSRLGTRFFAARFKADRVVPPAAAVRAHATGLLPEYMVPGLIEVVDELPTTQNGKIDRDLLRSWIPRKRGGAAAGSGAEPLDELERQIADVWAGLLNVPRVGREDNFFELGGDSLLAARLTGDICERIPDAAGMFFEDMLGELLQAPTVAALARFVRQTGKAETAGQDVPDEAGVLLLAEGPDAAGAPLVFVHDPTGAVTCFQPVADLLDGHHTVYALVPEQPEAWLGTDPDALIERMASRYVDLLLTENQPAVHMVGHGVTGPLAVEVARQLGEAGVEVPRLTVVDGCRAASAEVPAEAWLDQLAGDKPPAEPARGLLRLMLAASARYEPELYSGNVALVTGADPALAPAGLRPDDPEQWRERCLGEVSVRAVPGGRALGLTLPDPAALASVLADGPGDG